MQRNMTEISYSKSWLLITWFSITSYIIIYSCKNYNAFNSTWNLCEVGFLRSLFFKLCLHMSNINVHKRKLLLCLNMWLLNTEACCILLFQLWFLLHNKNCFIIRTAKFDADCWCFRRHCCFLRSCSNWGEWIFWDFQFPEYHESPFVIILYFACLGYSLCKSIDCIWFLALQVIKQRMQTRQFASAPDAVRLIVSKEGFKGLYAVC